MGARSSSRIAQSNAFRTAGGRRAVPGSRPGRGPESSVGVRASVEDDVTREGGAEVLPYDDSSRGQALPARRLPGPSRARPTRGESDPRSSSSSWIPRGAGAWKCVWAPSSSDRRRSSSRSTSPMMLVFLIRGWRPRRDTVARGVRPTAEGLEAHGSDQRAGEIEDRSVFGTSERLEERRRLSVAS